MTEERASELIHRLKKLYYVPDLLLEDDIKRITDCIERQIPKKPIIYERHYECPCCGGMFRYESHEGANYCSKCSQSLDWKGV